MAIQPVSWKNKFPKQWKFDYCLATLSPRTERLFGPLFNCLAVRTTSEWLKDKTCLQRLWWLVFRAFILPVQSLDKLLAHYLYSPYTHWFIEEGEVQKLLPLRGSFVAKCQLLVLKRQTEIRAKPSQDNATIKAFTDSPQAGRMLPNLINAFVNGDDFRMPLCLPQWET